MGRAYGWGLAAVVVVLVSWVFYRFVAPKGWREWARAGLVQAFVIAFYAEMYGFPLTLYLLARFFGLDVTDSASSNLWSQLFGLGDLPMVVAMVVGYALVVLGVILLVEGWREVYRASREGRLAADGLYGVVRHPQYTGIFLAVFGEGVVHWPTLFSVVMFPVIVTAYVLLARREERQMIERFGDRYRDYRRRVPMFLPRWGDWRHLFRAIDRHAGRRGTGPAAGGEAKGAPEGHPS
ncbi:MAG: isoprenylcysteine carboxylmethyltransferase family protein [Gemmataceae bacterium]|nr:isoprenylcysteine carboxylmethyltransferase family protein [Gemmataceae bacterium]